MLQLVLLCIAACLVSGKSTKRCTLWLNRASICSEGNTTLPTRTTEVPRRIIVPVWIVLLVVLSCGCCCRYLKTFACERGLSASGGSVSRTRETHAPSLSSSTDRHGNNNVTTEVMVGPSIISQDPPPYNFQPDPSIPPPYEVVVNGCFEKLQICDGRYDTHLQ